ncbi:MAG: metallophosphoesterase [Lachnospiraceae bacterium]|nr:metallophosphoesterase [Lachnospiraceae bacterium]
MQEFWIGLLILAALYLIIQIVADTNRFHVVRYTIDITGSGKDLKLDRPLRIAFLSDLHGKRYGRDNEKLLAAVDGIAPDVVLIGGDMLTAHEGADIEQVFSLVRDLSSKYPVYYGSGNHEQRLALYPERFGDLSERLEKGIAENGAVRLINDSVLLEGFPVEISSVEIQKRFYSRGRKPRMHRQDMHDCLTLKDRSRFQILMAHNPEYFRTYRRWGADLVLSGHVHGGIVRLPILGGVISPRVRLFPQYDGGHFNKENKDLIVSRGLGSHTIPLRLWNPGELVEIEIR